MSRLCIDIGNTRTKVGWFQEEDLLHSWVLETERLEQLLGSLLEEEDLKPESVAWLSTGRVAALTKWPLWEKLPSRPYLFEINADCRFPVKNAYATPETLGLDRLVGVVAAWASNPGHPVLVIDAGTAITYDYADAGGVYYGGGISPGLQMRFRALQTFTARLPLVEASSGPVPLVGDSTIASIQSGVVNGILAEMDGIIERYRARAGAKLLVYLCGGDMTTFENQLKSINFADSNLILRGIARTLSVNSL